METQELKSRTATRRFHRLLNELSDHKKLLIDELGFSGLRQLQGIEISFDLCAWLVKNFNVEYAWIKLNSGRKLEISEADVSTVLGLPCEGDDLIIGKNSDKADVKSLVALEQLLKDVDANDIFQKYFLIYACATILAPSGRAEGSHEIWHCIWSRRSVKGINWSRFLLKYLVDGIRYFRINNTSYLRGSLIFMQLMYLSATYLNSIQVPITEPRCVAWSDALVRRRLAIELESFGAYGQAQLLKVSPVRRKVTTPSSSIPTKKEKREEVLSHIIHAHNKIRQLMRDLEVSYRRLEEIERASQATGGDDNESHIDDEFGGEEGNHVVRSPHFVDAAPNSCTTGQSKGFDGAIAVGPVDADVKSTSVSTAVPTQVIVQQSPVSPSSNIVDGEKDVNAYAGSLDFPSTSSFKRKRCEQRARRMVARAAVCKSPFVEACMKKFPCLTENERAISNYVLFDGDNREILCTMYGYHLTREDLQCLGEEKWVNNSVMIMICRMLTAQSELAKTGSHYVDPTFSSTILATCKEGLVTSRIVAAGEVFCNVNNYPVKLNGFDEVFVPLVLRNHWLLLVINFIAKRIEVLDSLNITRNARVIGDQRKLLKAIQILRTTFGGGANEDISKFPIVPVDVPQQSNTSDCGIFVIKFMMSWSHSKFSTTIVPENSALYRLITLAALVLNPNNKKKSEVYEAANDLADQDFENMIVRHATGVQP